MDIDSSDSDDAKIENYRKQLRQFKSQGFKERLGSDVEEEEDDGLYYFFVLFAVHIVTFFSTPVHMHGGLICIALHPSVRLSVT